MCGAKFRTQQKNSEGTTGSPPNFDFQIRHRSNSEYCIRDRLQGSASNSANLSESFSFNHNHKKRKDSLETQAACS